MSKQQFEKQEAARDVLIERSKRELYEELQSADESPFLDTTLTDIFLFAMAYGSKKSGKSELKGDTQALFNRSSLNDDKRWLIRSLAVREHRTTEVLKDGKEIYRIAMEYANQGIEDLHGKVFGPSDALIDLSDEVIEIAEKADTTND